MSEYKLNVRIDTAALPILIKAGYKLCIAKKVNNSYTVIWQGGDVLYNNDFAWQTKFEVFGSEKFESGARVQASTNAEGIKSGQIATLDQYGVMGPAGGRIDTSGKLTVQNNYRPINIGLNSYLNGKYSPFYVSQNPFVLGSITLQPIETVMVWFATEVTSGTMILAASSEAIEVDFTRVPGQSLLYKISDSGAGVWILNGDQPVLPMTYNFIENSFSIPEPDAATLALITQSFNAPAGGSGALTCTVPVVAAVELADGDAAATFADYLVAHKPVGFAGWEVSKTGSAVSVIIEAEFATGEEASVRAASDKYLELLYAFGGPKPVFKALSLTVKGRLGNSQIQPSAEPVPVPVNGIKQNGTPAATTGTAVVHFEDEAAATAFAEQLNDATSPGATFRATARGVAVTVKLEAKGNKDTAAKRIRQSYDAAVAAFQSVPSHPEPVYVGPIVWDQL
ncbi:hypothetical protein C2E23DRAFT_886530 [Lenzites betulinus]|nr:hypothetical protein C2E23DRAFT_886530 [Lenzites betulinus]